MASVHSLAENNFIHSLAGHNIWLGGSDDDTEGKWKWSDGAPWSFENWSSDNQPNGRRRENYVLIIHDGKWHDFPGSSKEYFACKISLIV